MSDLPLEEPLRITQAWLLSLPEVAALVAQRVAPHLTGTYPAIRLTDLGPMNRTAAGDQYRIQVECWTEDHDTARSLAGRIVAGTTAARGTWWHGYCAGAEVVAGPFANPDQDSERFRYQLDVGMWLFPHPRNAPSTP